MLSNNDQSTDTRTAQDLSTVRREGTDVTAHGSLWFLHHVGRRDAQNSSCHSANTTGHLHACPIQTSQCRLPIPAQALGLRVLAPFLFVMLLLLSSL